MRIATPAFFWFPFACNIFFNSLTFSLYVSLDLKWVSCRQWIYGSCFCIHSASLCLLAGAFNPFEFKIIIDVYLFIYCWQSRRTCTHLFFRKISHASKIMFKILQALLQQYVNHELPDVQAGFKKGRGTRDQIANICWIIKKAREFQKNIYFCFIDYTKDFHCVDNNKLWKILKEMGVLYHLTCLLRNLYAGQEATVRIGHGTKDWFQIGQEVCQGCVLSPCLFNFDAEYIMQNARLDETQADWNQDCQEKYK